MTKFIYSMEPRELFRQLVYLYANARKPSFYHPRLSRGRSHSVSSQVEDLFAYFLSLNFVGEINYLIDQPLNHGKNQLCPDITLVEQGVVCHLFDVKTDLGWNRDGLSAFCAKQSDRLRDFDGIELSATDGMTKKKYTIKSDGNLQYHVVIISGLNISSEKLSKQLIEVEKLDKVHVYVLYPQHHPNYYGTDIDSFVMSVLVNDKDFDRIEHALTKKSSGRGINVV